MSETKIDPVSLTVKLVQCPSVTPAEAGALKLLHTILKENGFECYYVDRGKVSNLFARCGKKGATRTFGFNGHTDVVPVGDRSAWTTDPFGAEIRDGYVWGRGSSDMKSGVAAFVAAAIGFASEMPTDGAIILAITGDEEAEAVDGTTAILDWMADRGEAMTVCLVGEPTCPNHMGEAMKIGRRGSITFQLTATGIQGHVAYPDKANNPVPAMSELVNRLCNKVLDEGSEYFDPSTLAVTTFDTGNTATNVIPAECRVTLNIRFNDIHTSESLLNWINEEIEATTQDTGIGFQMKSKVSGESFFTLPGQLSSLVSDAVGLETNRTPKHSTSGGTSDARFIKQYCPVVEFGLVPHRMHGIDECVNIAHIQQLSAIYSRILRDYFA